MGELSGYMTLGRFVYLGRAGKNVRERAKYAGLIPVTGKKFTKLHRGMMPMNRVMCSGTWYDTVKY